MRRLLLCLSTLAFFALGFHAQADNAPTSEKDWTILVYLNAHNSLDDASYLNMNQMENVGSSDQVNVVVQWASTKLGTTERLLMQKDSDTTNVTSPVVQNMGPAVDMGDANTLKEFILWGMHNYPAKHYFVDVWDHGSGWHQFTGSSYHPHDISWDDSTGHFITTAQLGQVIRESAAQAGHKIDIYGSDACLMQMLEVAGEMKGAIDYFVGSQEVEPAAGWPYDLFLKPLVASPDMTPAQVASLLVDTYNQYYTTGDGAGTDVTFSALDMSQFDAIEASIRQLGQDIATLPAANHPTVLSAVTSTQAFTYNDYGDLGDFLKILYAQKELSSFATHVQTAENVLQQLVIRNRPTTGYALAQGVSLWLPKDADTYTSNKALYQTLAFDHDTGWSTAIATYLK